MKHDARALVGGAAPRSAKEHVVLALLNAQWRGGSALAEQLLFTTTIQEPFLLDEPARAKWVEHDAASATCRARCRAPGQSASRRRRRAPRRTRRGGASGGRRRRALAAGRGGKARGEWRRAWRLAAAGGVVEEDLRLRVSSNELTRQAGLGCIYIADASAALRRHSDATATPR